MCLAVSVDWEGASLDEADLAALERVERALPEMPLTHFLNAAYFTRSLDPTAAFARLVRAGDERGVHVHAWRSLVEAAGVAPRTTPSFLAPDREGLAIDGETGFDIELESYSVEEIGAIVEKSRSLLGLDAPRSFRAGAWLAGPRVLEAVRRAGFTIDSSATDAAWLDELADRPLPARVRALWPQVRSDTQPWIIATPAGPIVQMPLTGATADYATPEEMSAHVESMLRLADREQRAVFVQLGLHQEGAAELADGFIEVIAAIMGIGQGGSGPIRSPGLRFDTIAGCAELHRDAIFHGGPLFHRDARKQRAALGDADDR